MSNPKVMWQQFFPSFLMALLLFPGVASGQGRYELQDRGQQQPLESDMANRELPGLEGPKTIDKYSPKAKNKKAPRVTGIKKSAKGTIPKPDSFGPSSRQHGVEQAKGPQIGVSGSGLLGRGDNQSGSYGSYGSTSFLDGYLLKSLHADRLKKKKSRREEMPNDDLPRSGKTAPKF
jgi:hypothetical protein